MYGRSCPQSQFPPDLSADFPILIHQFLHFILTYPLWTLLVVVALRYYTPRLVKLPIDIISYYQLSKPRARKKAIREAEFKELRSKYVLEGENLRISRLDWDSLIQGLQTRKLTATQVLSAYIAKSLVANDRTNAITDYNFKCFDIAKELDDLPQVKGPLHGIPVAVKDDFNVKGLDCSHGFARRLFKPAGEDAVIVKTLMDLGAIPFCKTNVPQTLFTFGSDNPIYGITLNPRNPELSPGGSSSGSGALVGAAGCFFAVGSDCGGSVRIPAHFCGVSSIKPTVGRLSEIGVEHSLPNLTGIRLSPGIIGQTPSIVSSVFKHLCDGKLQNKYDSFIPPIPWDDALYRTNKKLRIGYYTSLPYFPAMGDTEEIVQDAKSCLEKLGHTLVPFQLPCQYKIMNVCARLMIADQGRHFKNILRGESVAQSAYVLYIGAKFPHWMHKLGGYFMSKISSTRRTGCLLGAGAERSTDLWDALGDKHEIIGQLFEEWDKKQIDVLLCPAFPFPSTPIHLPPYLAVAAAYTLVYNFTDFPAGVLNFGTESGKNLDNYNTEGDFVLNLALKGAKKSIGAPIGVQIVGLPYKEELVLNVMNQLEPFAPKIDLESTISN